VLRPLKRGTCDEPELTSYAKQILPALEVGDGQGLIDPIPSAFLNAGAVPIPPIPSDALSSSQAELNEALLGAAKVAAAKRVRVVEPLLKKQHQQNQCTSLHRNKAEGDHVSDDSMGMDQFQNIESVSTVPKRRVFQKPFDFIKYLEKNKKSEEFVYLRPCVSEHDSSNPYNLEIVEYAEIERNKDFYTISRKVRSFFLLHKINLSHYYT
jgi:hypothetical protein